MFSTFSSSIMSSPVDSSIALVWDSSVSTSIASIASGAVNVSFISSASPCSLGTSATSSVDSVSLAASSATSGEFSTGIVSVFSISDNFTAVSGFFSPSSSRQTIGSKMLSGVPSRDPFDDSFSSRSFNCLMYCLMIGFLESSSFSTFTITRLLNFLSFSSISPRSNKIFLSADLSLITFSAFTAASDFSSAVSLSFVYWMCFKSGFFTGAAIGDLSFSLGAGSGGSSSSDITSMTSCFSSTISSSSSSALSFSLSSCFARLSIPVFRLSWSVLNFPDVYVNKYCRWMYRSLRSLKFPEVLKLVEFVSVIILLIVCWQISIPLMILSSNSVLAVPKGVFGCGARATEMLPFCCVKIVEAEGVGAGAGAGGTGCATTRPSENVKRVCGWILNRWRICGPRRGTKLARALAALAWRIVNCGPRDAVATGIPGRGGDGAGGPDCFRTWINFPFGNRKISCRAAWFKSIWNPLTLCYRKI